MSKISCPHTLLWHEWDKWGKYVGWCKNKLLHEDTHITHPCASLVGKISFKHDEDWVLFRLAFGV